MPRKRLTEALAEHEGITEGEWAKKYWHESGRCISKMCERTGLHYQSVKALLARYRLKNRNTAQLARRHGIKPQKLYARLRRMPKDEAVTTPIRGKQKEADEMARQKLYQNDAQKVAASVKRIRDAGGVRRSVVFTKEEIDLIERIRVMNGHTTDRAALSDALRYAAAAIENAIEIAATL